MILSIDSTGEETEKDFFLEGKLSMTGERNRGLIPNLYASPAPTTDKGI